METKTNLRKCLEKYDLNIFFFYLSKSIIISQQYIYCRTFRTMMYNLKKFISYSFYSFYNLFLLYFFYVPFFLSTITKNTNKLLFNIFSYNFIYFYPKHLPLFNVFLFYKYNPLILFLFFLFLITILIILILSI